MTMRAVHDFFFFCYEPEYGHMSPYPRQQCHHDLEDAFMHGQSVSILSHAC
jgi:hypothetical protein